jgi:hypothetical protein
VAVKEYPLTSTIQPKKYKGLTADTVAWLAAHTTEPDGSSYRELDGAKRIYEIQDGVWYEL